MNNDEIKGGKIVVKIENGKTPIWAKQLNGISRQSIAELIAVLETLKQDLINQYNKTGTRLSKSE